MGKQHQIVKWLVWRISIQSLEPGTKLRIVPCLLPVLEKTSKGVPTLIEKPPRLVASEEQKDIQNDNEIDNYSSIALGSVGILLQNIGTHPFIVFRRQCQV